MSLDRILPLEDRAVLVAARRRQLDRKAQQALLSAFEHLATCCLAAMSRLMRQPDPSGRLMAKLLETRIALAEATERAQILAARLEKIEPRHRPHYSPQARFRILAHMRKYLLSVEDTARRFLLTEQTLYNWLAELAGRPEAQTVGSLLKPVPPLRRYADVVRQLARQMKATGFGGSKLIAATLARIGWKPSRRSVTRFCKEKRAPAPAPSPGGVSPKPTTVRGRYPNHLWLVDITRIPLLFPFLHLQLALVLDAFSRMPLAASVSYFEPSAAAILALVQKAIARHRKPKHLVSDQGEQFRADLFRAGLRALGIRQRFGAVGQHGSIALIERCWRSLKDDLSLRSMRPWSLQDFEPRLNAALLRYAYLRPHSALDGRVPAEAYFGLSDQRPLLNLAPRGRADEPGPDCPVEIAFLDSDTATLPILVPKAA